MTQQWLGLGEGEGDEENRVAAVWGTAVVGVATVVGVGFNWKVFQNR